MILNLHELNDHIALNTNTQTKQNKQTNKQTNRQTDKQNQTGILQTALLLVTRDCYFASVNFYHAYYSNPVQKFEKFYWKGTLHAYQTKAVTSAPVSRL